MTAEERRALLGDVVVEAAQRVADEAPEPSQALRDSIAVLLRSIPAQRESIDDVVA